MSTKAFVVILILGVVANYIVALIDALIRNSLLGGSAGLPFKFASGTVFGEANTNYLSLFLDILFWFIVIWLIWRFFLNKKSKLKK